MNNEVIFFYVLQTISGVIGIFTAFMILKYLNQKALGMQTIYDLMVKDKIYISVLSWTDLLIMEVIGEYKSQPLNHKEAIFLTILNGMITIAGIWQVSMILLIKYLSVFYQNLMNNVDDYLVMRITRSFIGFTAMISALMIDFENTSLYQLLTDKDSKDDNLFPAKPMFFAIFICLIFLITTQYKIEKFKENVDSKSQFHQLESGEGNQEIVYKYEMNTNRIEICIICISLIIVVFMLFLRAESLKFLRILLVIVQIINTNVIPIVLIVRSENILCFFKCECQIMKLLNTAI